jgi:hypothetical protein
MIITPIDIYALEDEEFNVRILLLILLSRLTQPATVLPASILYFQLSATILYTQKSGEDCK